MAYIYMNGFGFVAEAKLTMFDVASIIPIAAVLIEFLPNEICLHLVISIIYWLA